MNTKDNSPIKQNIIDAYDYLEDMICGIKCDNEEDTQEHQKVIKDIFGPGWSRKKQLL